MNNMSSKVLFAVCSLIQAVAGWSTVLAGENVWRGSFDVQSAPLIEESGQHDDYTGWGGGQLGQVVGIGTHVQNPDLSIEGHATWVAADGELLYVSFEGSIVITEDPKFPYRFSGQLFALGGTGRLASATGKAQLQGTFSNDLQYIQFEFEGTMDVAGNFQAAGKIELDGLGCGLGQSTEYELSASSDQIGFSNQSGVIMPVSTPIIDESLVRQTVIRLAAEQGPNPDAGGRPMHVITTGEGQIFCRWDARIRIEIENQAGLAVLKLDGFFTVLGGTGRYQDVSGAWQTLVTTQPSYGDGIIAGDVVMDGSLFLKNPIALTVDRNQKQKTNVVNFSRQTLESPYLGKNRVGFRADAGADNRPLRSTSDEGKAANVNQRRQVVVPSIKRVVDNNHRTGSHLKMP